jgi:hypothetical protein
VLQLFQGKVPRVKSKPLLFTCDGPIANRRIVLFSAHNNKPNIGVLGIPRRSGRRNYTFQAQRMLSPQELKQIELNVVE